MRGLAIVLAGVLLFVMTGQGNVDAQERRLPPDAVSEETWQAFVEATGEDVETRRRAHFRRADFEPVLAEWSEEFGAVLVPEWKYALRDRDIEGGEHRWRIEQTTYDTMVGEFNVFVLHQSGGGQFRESFVVPQDWLDDVDYEYAESVSQGTPFEARMESFERSDAGVDADFAIALLCDRASSSYSIPRASGEGDDDARVQFRFRDRTIREMIHRIAGSVGWTATISHGEVEPPKPVAFEHLEYWLDAKGGDNEAETWRGAMKELLRLKLVKFEARDLHVQVNAKS